MYGEQHLLAYKSQEESKVVYSLSMRQLGWWILGAILSLKLYQILPPIPGIDYWGYIPHTIPFLIALAFAHIKHPGTQMGLLTYIKNYVSCRLRKRVFR